MSDIVHVDSYDLQTTHDTQHEFETDVACGLEKPNKQLSYKHLYDENGCELFNQITRHPDYYLTRCELEILTHHKQQLAALLGSTPFNLVELGPGDGSKAQILIKQFTHDSLNFIYSPIDICTEYLIGIASQFQKHLPTLDVTPIHSTYFRGLEWVSDNISRRNVVLFLGSSIGNFAKDEMADFFQHLWLSLHNNDYALIGFDLAKNSDILLRAYDDNAGITRAFNLNLLKRINRELSADFVLENFRHQAVYNAQDTAMESYLISEQDQRVNLNHLAKTFFFKKSEKIHIETSHKYHLSQITELAENNGFRIVGNFSDSKNYFVDSLWQVIK